MRSKIFIGITVVVFFGLSFFLTLLVSKNNSLSQEVTHLKSLAKKMEVDVKEANKAKDTLAQEKEKLQSDATSYIAINTRVTQEKEKLQEALDTAKKTLDMKEADLERAKINLQKAQKEAEEKKGTAEGGSSQAEVEKLQKKVADLEKNSEKDKATFYYNLGVAYTQAKYYDDAVDSYEKSLKLDNTNAEAHYNLGLIYGNISKEPAKALVHYVAYLKLKPDASDRDEVEGLIKNLKP